MSPENKLKLTSDFPLLYRKGEEEVEFRCLDGWFDVIYDLSAKLEALIEVQEGKKALATQVKQKFGSLRFYTLNATDEMLGLIARAEDSTNFICENCGASGKLRSLGFIQTLCDEDFEKMKKLK